MQAEVFGTYRALVTSTADPTNSSRIRVICPQISGTAELNWAEPANISEPVPHTGDIVWIFFNGGETYKPVYMVTVERTQVFTWQTPTLGTGWATGPSGGSVQNIQYRFDTQDNVYIVGSLHTTSTTPSSTLFTLPGPVKNYVPNIEQRFITAFNNAGTISASLIQVQSPSGNVVVSPTPTVANADIYINAIFPRGNIS